MTGADVPPLAQEAIVAAEAHWQAHGGADTAFEAGWAAALQWAAQLADHVSAAFPPPQCEHPEHWKFHGLNPFASLLRQGGEGGGT